MYEEVLEFATRAHEGQVRRYTEEPYIKHPIEVVSILQEGGYNLPVLNCVAILHDVVEDTEYTHKDIYDNFGEEIMEGVFWLTDISTPMDGNRMIRKKMDAMHTASCPNAYYKMIKCADLISNTESIIKHDPNFAKVYLKENKSLLDLMHQMDGNMPEYALYRRALQLSSI